MKPIVEPDKAAALNGCARIVKRPIDSIGPIRPASPGGLAHLYAVHFKRLHQTARMPGTAATVIQPTARKE